MFKAMYINRGKAEGEYCDNGHCKGKATHFHTITKKWFCYWCAREINGRAKEKRVISSAEKMWQDLSTPVTEPFTKATPL
jgi:DNA-binding helix-hairpin-helix protein with protein kinase domain